MTAAAYDEFMNHSGAAGEDHFVDGYQVVYDRNIGEDSMRITLVELRSPDDADETKPESDGSYEHDVQAVKGSRLMFVEYLNDKPSPPPLLASFAEQQYARL